MTLFNICKSNNQIESQQNKIVHLEEELSFQHRKHKDTLGFFKKELSLQECDSYLKYEKVTLNYEKRITENEAIFHKSLMDMVQERDILRQTILSLDSESKMLKKENECLKLDMPKDVAVEDGDDVQALAKPLSSEVFLSSSSEEFLSSSSREFLPSSSEEFLPSSSEEYLPSSSQEYLPSSSQECLPSSSQECLPSSSQGICDSGQRPRIRRSGRPAPTMLEPPDCTQS